jgi:hypothetical protein
MSHGVFNVSILRMYLVLLAEFGEKRKAKKIDLIPLLWLYGN